MRKPDKDMIEGPEAWIRFASVMKHVIAVPHSEIKKKIEAHRAEVAKNPNRPGPKPKTRVFVSRVPRV
jgi:hypothetical protein